MSSILFELRSASLVRFFLASLENSILKWSAVESSYQLITKFACWMWNLRLQSWLQFKQKQKHTYSQKHRIHRHSRDIQQNIKPFRKSVWLKKHSILVAKMCYLRHISASIFWCIMLQFWAGCQHTFQGCHTHRTGHLSAPACWLGQAVCVPNQQLLESDQVCWVRDRCGSWYLYIRDLNNLNMSFRTILVRCWVIPVFRDYVSFQTSISDSTLAYG